MGGPLLGASILYPFGLAAEYGLSAPRRIGSGVTRGDVDGARVDEWCADLGVVLS